MVTGDLQRVLRLRALSAEPGPERLHETVRGITSTLVGLLHRARRDGRRPPLRSPFTDHAPAGFDDLFTVTDLNDLITTIIGSVRATSSRGVTPTRLRLR